MDRFSHRILEHLSDRRYRPTPLQILAEELGISPDELEEFNRSITQMIDKGQVVLGTSEALALPPPGREMAGVFRLNERGFGFLTPDNVVGHGDLFIPAGQTGGALTGDRVRARVIHEPRRGGAGRSPYTGKIIQIVQRADRRYVGNLRKIGSQFVVEIDGRLLRDPVGIRDPHAKNAKPGDKVVIELIDYPTELKPAQGVITEVLGEEGEPDVETQAVMRAFGLKEHFPEQAIQDARTAAHGFAESAIPADREDLTGQFIITIDPPDAKDYDDAISLRRLDGKASGPVAKWPGGQGKESGQVAQWPRGQGEEQQSPAEDHSAARTLGHSVTSSSPPGAVWELGVHIAHVSHFVRPGTELDAEARRRGNSAYLPRKVVPMLPELLSNGVCSLQEAVNRYCLSAFLWYDAQGNVVGQHFAKTVIRSAKRLTYLEAQALIEGDLREAVKHAVAEPKYPRGLIETLGLMNELAQVIRRRRLGQGMIVLDLPEVELVFDESGRVIDAVPEDDAFTHKLIEMFMVEANEAAARVFDSLNVPMIRRIHADPPSHDLTELRQFARVAGFNIPARPSRRELQGLLDSVRGKPAQRAVHLALLQTLSRAEYSPALIGHFALASEHYTHFTSPIRRYPDLLVHRGLDAYLELRGQMAGGLDARSPKQREMLGQRLRADPRLPSEETLVEMGSHFSATERNAEAAEKMLRTYLVLDLLAGHLGDDFDATVTGVTGQGVFMQLDRYLVDGFVRLTDLPGQMSDTWKLNRATGALVAQRSGKSITIGDRYVVRIAKVNPARRQLDVVIISAHGAAPKAPKRQQPPGARKAHEFSMRLKRQRKREKRKK